MTNKGILLLCCAITLTACGLFKSKTPPIPPEPTIVALEFEADEDINPDDQGRPSPLVIRVYQLKYYDAFKDADYNALIENDTKALGNELIDKREIFLKPGQKFTELLKDVSDDVRSIGFMGRFRDQSAQWQAGSGIKKNKTTVIKVRVSGTTITSQLQVNQ